MSRMHIWYLIKYVYLTWISIFFSNNSFTYRFNYGYFLSCDSFQAKLLHRNGSQKIPDRTLILPLDKLVIEAFQFRRKHIYCFRSNDVYTNTYGRWNNTWVSSLVAIQLIQMKENLSPFFVVSFLFLLVDMSIKIVE